MRKSIITTILCGVVLVSSAQSKQAPSNSPDPKKVLHLKWDGTVEEFTNLSATLNFLQGHLADDVKMGEAKAVNKNLNELFFVKIQQQLEAQLKDTTKVVVPKKSVKQ